MMTTNLNEIIGPLINRWRVPHVARRVLDTGEPVMAILPPKPRELFKLALLGRIATEPVYFVEFGDPVHIGEVPAEVKARPSPTPYFFVALLEPNSTRADRLRITAEMLRPPEWWLGSRTSRWARRRPSASIYVPRQPPSQRNRAGR